MSLTRLLYPIRLLLAACACLVLAQVAAAQAPDRQTVLVYTVYADRETSYSQAFYPPGVDTIYIRSDRPNAIIPRRTDIYFWPITGEFRADWNARDDRLGGTLDILQDGRLIATESLVEFVALYDPRHPTKNRRLVTGPAAHAAIKDYEAAHAAWFDSLQAYRVEQRRFDEAMRAAIRDAAAGRTPNVPTLPTPPEDFSLLISELQRGFVLNLPPGRYEVQYRGDDGRPVPELRRDLISFAPRRTAISYRVLPRSRWTVPERSFDVTDTIYLDEATTLFFQPIHALEFNEQYYTRADTPQDRQTSADRWLWVEVERVEDATLHIESPSGGQTTVQRRPYYVQQLAGTLGYEVLEWEPGRFGSEPASFEAYAVPMAERASEARVWLETAGVPLPGSARDVRAVQTQYDQAAYLLPLLPLIVGAVVAGRRRGRGRPSEVNS